MLRGMDPEEVATWRAFYTIYPMPGERADINAGTIRHSIYQMHAGKNDVPKLDECITNYEPKPKLKAMPTNAVKSGLKSMCKGLPVIYLPRPKNGSDQNISD